MLVPILREPGSLPEWAVVELKGELGLSNTTINPENNNCIGDLHYQTNADNTPILIIGVNVLHGKETLLPKPIAVLEKQKSNDSTTEYIVKCVIKKKLVFRSRPRPIVNETSNKS